MKGLGKIKMKKYSIGIDFGTLSARAILVDLKNGKELESSVFEYPHKVIEKNFNNEKIDNSYAFQHPQDYLDALSYTLKDLIKKTNVNTDDIVGVGIDFTSCTMLPVKNDGTPLCFLDEFKNEPMAYVKLWKHHGAEKEAEYMTKIAEETNQKWLKKYGGKVSSEWLFPKILETLNKAPDVYNETDRFIEAGEWIVWMLTGNEIHSSCMAGYKGMYNKKGGFPDKEYFRAVALELENIIGSKISENISTVGTKAGEICDYGEKLTGLKKGTAVAVPIIDAHASLPAAGVVNPKKLMLIIGTSSCHIILSEEEKNIEGLCGVVEDGVIPGYYGYEAGQCCVGDSFSWYIDNCVPKKYYDEALANNKDIYSYMEEKAKALKVGESGLVTLDWFNGNRTPLVNYNLTSSISGLTLKTTPEEIYRSIIESTAFGTKVILDLYENNGVEVDEIIASGGIAEKSELCMQIYADVTGRPIKISASPQACALGSAMFASVCGGYFPDISSASAVMSKIKEKIYYPISENCEKYKELYNKYCEMVKFFS